MPKISAIVPAYNIELYIEQCLNSLINQTLNDIEIIVVNDGSTDNTKNIIERKVEQDSRIKLINKPNGGQSEARNLGLEKANGEYIAFIDGDDWISEDTFEKIYKKAQESSSEIVIYDFEEIYENGLKVVQKEIKDETSDLKKSYMVAMPGFCNKLYKREFLNQINFKFPNGIFYEDLAIYPYVASKATKIEYVPLALYKYRMRSGSTMKQEKNTKKLNDIFKVFNIIEENMAEVKDEYKEELEYIYIKHLLHAASLRFLCYNSEDKKIEKISDIMKEKYPNWKNNYYFKNENWKYKLVCKLIYKKKINLLRMILRQKVMEE